MSPSKFLSIIKMNIYRKKHHQKISSAVLKHSIDTKKKTERILVKYAHFIIRFLSFFSVHISTVYKQSSYYIHKILYS